MVKREDILKPLIFLDIFDYQPTAMEVWRFLGVEAELGEVIEALPQGCHTGGGRYPVLEVNAKQMDPGLRRDDTLLCHPRENGDPEFGALTLDSRLRGNDTEKRGTAQGATHPVSEYHPPAGGTPLFRGDLSGFYFLPGREGLIEKRREFFYLSERKFKIAQKAARILRFIPGVKMVAVCNNFYYRPESDIDFFIITAAKRLWVTRFLATIFLDLFNLRARGQKTADRICLSFYLSENNLNLEEVALKSLAHSSVNSAGEETLWSGDPCLACWLAFMEPLYGYEIYEKFWQANNLPASWFKKIFPNAFLRCPPQIRLVCDNSLSKIIKKIGSVLFFGSLGDWLEKNSEKIQRFKLSARVKELAAQDNTNVVLDKRMLKFHEEDDRENFREKLHARILTNKNE
jgi:hypothetical protein